MAHWWIVLRTFFVLTFVTTFSVCGRADTQRASVTKTFPYPSAVMNRIVNGERKLIRVSGEINGIAVTGSGVYTFSPAIAAIFAGQSGMSNRETFIAKLSGKDKVLTMEINFDYIEYYDSNYHYLGEVDKSTTSGDADQRYGRYTVVTGKGSIPVTIRANDFGSLSSATVYKDQTKTVKLGARTRSYVVEPDTASSVIYRISERYFGKSGSFIRSAEGRYRFDAEGGCTLVSWDNRNKKSTLHFVVEQ